MAYTVYHPTLCEECGADLTAEAGVMVHWSAGGHEFDVFSYVHPNGILADPCDGPVAKGLHAGTYCAKCGELVEEIRGPRTRPTKTKIVLVQMVLHPDDEEGGALPGSQQIEAALSASSAAEALAEALRCDVQLVMVREDGVS